MEGQNGVASQPVCGPGLQGAAYGNESVVKSSPGRGQRAEVEVCRREQFVFKKCAKNFLLGEKVI